MKGAFEFVLSELPLVVRRTVKLSDNEFAGVVYAGRFSNYLRTASGCNASTLL